MFQLPTRIPRLYYGPQRWPRQQTQAEKRADMVYGYLAVGSEFLFLIFAALGYSFYQIYGLIALGAAGYALGIWIRRSLGMRGRKVTTGFFKRMRERSQGSPPGLLERLLEGISQKPYSPEQCRAVTNLYEKSVAQLRKAQSKEEQNQVLQDLDYKVKKMLMGR